MLLLSFFPLFSLFHLCFCTSELVTLLDESTDGIKECNSQGTVSCQKIAVNLTALGEDTLVFPNGKLMTKHQTLENGFEYEGSDGSDAILSVIEGRLDASLNYYEPDMLLNIENCGEGCHVLMQSNEDGNNGHVDGRTPPDSLQVDDPPPELRSILLPEAPKEPEDREGEATDRSTTEISVMWYYTKQFDDVTSDPRGYVELLNTHANTAYANSNINLRLKTKCVEMLPSNIRESANILNDFGSIKGGSRSAIRQNADIAMLVTSRPVNGWCGQAYVGPNVATRGSGIGWVGKDCQITVTPHEVGHLFGCCHNKEQQSSCGTSYGLSYGYGYWVPGTNKYTVMAYPGGGNNRISQKFSSPTYTVDGVRAGTSTQDCRRGHNEYKDAISRAGNEAGSCDGGNNGGNCENAYSSDASCNAWASAGYCTHSYVAWMSANCEKACGLCGGTTPCTDSNTNCPYWAGRGYCRHTYVAWMSQNCKKSCNTC